MKAITTPARAHYLADRLKRNDLTEEMPPDREVRRLHNLSTDVGAACSAWLASRGIRTRPWGDFNLGRTKANRVRFGFHLDENL